MTNEQKMGVWSGAGFVVLVIVVGVIALAVSGSSTSTSQPTPTTTVPPITSNDWTRGKRDATVTLTEYGDFECPACRAYEPLVSQVMQAYGDKVLLAFRNFPLYQLHPDAESAAEAAEAAGLQGKYWEMHDLLYTKQTEWVTAAPADVVGTYFNSYAQSLGLNVQKFDTDMVSGVVKNKIARDVSSGNAAQIDHTPTFFINNVQIKNPGSYDSFKAVIDATLASSSNTKTTR